MREPAAIVTLLLLLAASPSCDSVWTKDHPGDPFRCEPACSGGRICRDGRCTLPAMDHQIPDLPRLDLNVTPRPWAVAGGGPGNDRLDSVAVDGAGNIFAAGLLASDGRFGPAQLLSKGKQDVLAAGLTPGGDVAWAINPGSSSTDYAYGIALDKAGRQYITGTIMGKALFNAHKPHLETEGQKDIFVVRRDRDGIFARQLSAGGSSSDIGTSVAVDSQGNVLLCGYFQESITLGSDTLKTSGGKDIFVAKLDADFKVQWAVSAGGKGTEDKAIHACSDGAGGAFVVGETEGGVFGQHKAASYGAGDIFIARIDQDGSFKWVFTAGGAQGEVGRTVVSDGNGGAHAAGFFRGSATFGAQTLVSAGSTDMFIAHLGGDGKLLSVRRDGGGGEDVIKALARDAAGNLLGAGYFYGSFSLGAFSLKSKGSSDALVFKLDKAGTYTRAITAGGIGGDIAHGIALDNSGVPHVAGCFSGTATFGKTTLTSRGGTDAFVWRVW